MHRNVGVLYASSLPEPPVLSLSCGEGPVSAFEVLTEKTGFHIIQMPFSLNTRPQASSGIPISRRFFTERFLSTSYLHQSLRMALPACRRYMQKRENSRPPDHYNHPFRSGQGGQTNVRHTGSSVTSIHGKLPVLNLFLFPFII